LICQYNFVLLIYRIDICTDVFLISIFEKFMDCNINYLLALDVENFYLVSEMLSECLMRSSKKIGTGRNINFAESAGD